MALSESQMRRARYVRTILAHHDLTQADLGQLLGISAQAANRKLKGLRQFKDDELALIAETFKIEPGLMLRPPELTGVLGSVRKLDGDLLTCTKYQLPLVTGGTAARYGYPAKSGRNQTLAAA